MKPWSKPWYRSHCGTFSHMISIWPDYRRIVKVMQARLQIMAKVAMLTAREKAKASRNSVANPCIIVPFQLKIGAKKNPLLLMTAGKYIDVLKDRGFFSFFSTQFLGAFNDNFYKIII